MHENLLVGKIEMGVLEKSFFSQLVNERHDPQLGCIQPSGGSAETFPFALACSGFQLLRHGTLVCPGSLGWVIYL